MRKFLSLKNAIIGSCILIIMSLSLYVFTDNYTAYKSQNFRTMQDKISSTEKIDLTGLRELQASGGSAPLFDDLKEKLRHIHQPKIAFDVRHQFHGYVKGIPSKFFSYHRSPNLRHLQRRLIYTGTIEKRPELFRTESQEAKAHGFDYVNISIGSRYIPLDENVDAFIKFFDTLPGDSWVHFHCDRGMGRTSMALVMYDIMKNAPKVTLEDIIRRQQLLGSEDLSDTTVWEGGSYSLKMLQDRKNFIEQFYKFVCQRKTDGIQRWSDWNHLEQVRKEV